MQSLFDESGFLRLDEIIYEMPSYQKIMEDLSVTDEEIIQQSDKVLRLLQQIEEQLNLDDKKLVIDTISEIAVLYALNNKR